MLSCCPIHLKTTTGAMCVKNQISTILLWFLRRWFCHFAQDIAACFSQFQNLQCTAVSTTVFKCFKRGEELQDRTDSGDKGKEPMWFWTACADTGFNFFVGSKDFGNVQKAPSVFKGLGTTRCEHVAYFGEQRPGPEVISTSLSNLQYRKILTKWPW